MLQQVWAGADRRITVCVDSYENGILEGRLCSPCGETVAFGSLMQFLLRMEALLEAHQIPQSYTVLRKFLDHTHAEQKISAAAARKGRVATFELQVLFRQHTSWQGMLNWREGKLEQSFRSVLELALLMDSALRKKEEGIAS